MKPFNHYEHKPNILWDFRIISEIKPPDGFTYSIRKVYYNNDMSLKGIDESPIVLINDDVTKLLEYEYLFRLAISKPILLLDEHKSIGITTLTKLEREKRLEEIREMQDRRKDYGTNMS